MATVALQFMNLEHSPLAVMLYLKEVARVRHFRSAKSGIAAKVVAALPRGS